MLKTVQNKMDEIEEKIFDLAKIVVDANELILDSLKKGDIEHLNSISIVTKDLQNRSDEIDNLIVTSLALFSLEAKDLRTMVSYLKITNEFVRAGTNTKSFIKTFYMTSKDGFDIYEDDVDEKLILSYLIPIQQASYNSIKELLVMLKSEDSEECKNSLQKVVVNESKTDDLYRVIEKDILLLMHNDSNITKEYFEILNSCRRIEKVADRALSIAYLILYAKDGGEIES
jgi:phosphate transport system protein